MLEPSDHFEKRGALEELLRKVPGFQGYLEQGYRRDSDRLQRERLAERLQASKRALDDVARSLADAAQIDAIPVIDRVRARLDRLIARIRGAVEGYSAMFDLVKIDEAVLDEVYEHDMALQTDVDALLDQAEQLRGKPSESMEQLPALHIAIDGIESEWNGRDDILHGLRW